MKGLHVDAVRPAWLVLAASAWMATVANLPLWRALWAHGLMQDAAGWGLALALAVLILGGLVVLLGLLSWRASLRPAVTLLLLVSAAGAHYMLDYGVMIDSTMVVNVLQTDMHEALDLWNLRMLLTLVLLAGLPAWFVWRLPLRRARAWLQARDNLLLVAGGLLLAAGAVLLAFQPLASAMRNHKELRFLMNPLNSLYAVGQVAARPLRRPPGPLQAVATDAVLVRPIAQARPPLLVLVLGETGRSGNFGINGYARDTTPELARAQVASFRDAWSCGTSTAASVPCMFSPLGREGFEARQRDSENLLDVLQRAGLAVLWVDNQSGCKGVCDRVPSASTAASADPRLCSGGECHDAILLEGLEARLQALPRERREQGVVVVLHTMGSHGPAYARRSPPAFKRFLPECGSTRLQDCSREELVNAYDNSIAYTDHVLASTIRWLQLRTQHYDGAMLYLADHGESLGEHNLYLHGMPYVIAPDVQKHVPWITWLSPGFEQRSGVAMACLRQATPQRITHDHLFHSVLGLMEVRTRAYRPALDAYGSCAGERGVLASAPGGQATSAASRGLPRGAAASPLRTAAMSSSFGYWPSSQ